MSSIRNSLEIVPATVSDYLDLACYHYATHLIRPMTQIYKIRPQQKFRSNFPDPIAVIVFRSPIPDLLARHRATKGYFRRPGTVSARLKLVNAKIQYAARLIVDPRFRKLGLATWLQEESLSYQTVPIIETLTPIDWTNKIPLRAGFKMYQNPAPVWYRRFTAALYSIGLTTDSLSCPSAVQCRIETLYADQAKFIEHEFRQFLSRFRGHHDMPPGIDRTKYALSKCPYPEAYFIWFNPRVHIDLEKPENFPVKNPIETKQNQHKDKKQITDKE